MSTQVSQAVARPVRTAVQAVPSFVITEFVDAFIVNLDDKQYAALAGFLLLVFGYLQVVVENQKGVAFMRRIIPGDVPVINTVEQRIEPEIKNDKPSEQEPVETTSVKASDPVLKHSPAIQPTEQRDNPALDELPENPDEFVSDEPVEPEHELNINDFDVEEEDK